MFAKEIKPSGFFDGIDGIVPVPLAKKRLRQRGYNQSEEIARGVAAISDLPIFDQAVRRLFFEGSQTSKGRWDRNENVENVFELVQADTIRGKHILLIDDVVTTGATIIACAKDSVRLVVSVSASSHLASPRADKWNRQVVRGKSQTLDGSILNVI